MGAVDIANALAASRKAVRLYPPEHPTHRQAVDGLCSAVTAAIDVRPLVLNLRDGRLYEASEVLTDASPATRALIEAMEVRRVESLTFHMGFNETDGTGVSEVLSLRPSPDLQIQVELEARDVRGVTVSELEDNLSREAEERDRLREADRSLYRHALRALKNTVGDLGTGKTVDSVEASRAIAQIIERVAEEPPAILALALMTGHGELWMFHAVSVMLHSVVLGHRLGMSDKGLLALGVAGLMHDMGSVLVTDEDTDADTVRAAHPLAGAHALGVLIDEEAASMIVAYEHHMGTDGSGFPEREDDYITHPYSRIVAIADRYDNLIRPRTGPALRPDIAILQLVNESSDGPLDPFLTRLFVQAVGVVPIGSTVRLTDHGIAIVRAPGENPLWPQVRLVLSADGTELRPSPDIDLTEDDRAIVQVMAGDVLGLVAADHL